VSPKVAKGGAQPRVGSTVREGWRRWLDGVPRQRRSPAAEEGGDEVLQLEEGTREVRDHLVEEKGARESSSPWGKNGSGDGSTTGVNGRPRGRRGGVLTGPMRKRMGEERERGGATRRGGGREAWGWGGGQHGGRNGAMGPSYSMGRHGQRGSRPQYGRRGQPHLNKIRIHTVQNKFKQFQTLADQKRTFP
jgi:hypothetical protein